METPLLAADALVLYGDGIVLIRRENPPYQGFYALPGGFVEVGETVEEAVRREAREETGLDIVPIKLVGVYSKPDRDPRGTSSRSLTSPGDGGALGRFRCEICRDLRLGGASAPRLRPRLDRQRRPGEALRSAGAGGGLAWPTISGRS